MKGNAPKPIEQTEVPKQDPLRARQEARRLLNERDYAGALAMIKDATARGVAEQVFAKEYLQAANGSFEEAESLMKQGETPSAALIFKAIQDSYPKSSELQQQIMVSPAQLAEKIDLCAEKLMAAGLGAYRSGKLSAAIDIWQQVLELKPQHQDAQNSIQTAQLQLSNLKSLKHSN